MSSEKYYKKHEDINIPLEIEGKCVSGEGTGADVDTDDGFELSMILTDYIGKRVRITIEIIDNK